jgi:PhzF family phenazine biosynthesis protein
VNQPFAARHPYTLVDVFSSGRASGNPLAVIHDADDLAPDRMQAIARYMNLSETVFLCRPTRPEADYALPIFALDRELPWAGHPTLGACHAWLEAAGRGQDSRRIVQQSASGLTELSRGERGLDFVAPPLQRFEPPSTNELRQALDLVGSDGTGLTDAMWIDNGPGWLGLLFDRAETILALKPLRSWPAALHIGVIGFHAPPEPCAIEARAFHTDQHFVAVEDPVTGSFAAATALWLVGAGRLPPAYCVSQGQCVGRAGRIEVVTRDGDIRVCGRVRTIIRGHAHF